LLDTPALENRHEDELALWIHPGEATGSWITGEYPPYTIQMGDRFRAEIGCLAEHPQCELTFQLDYRQANGVVRNLGMWEEVYDQKTTLIDLDLSRLAGETVRFMLTVENEGEGSDAHGFWFVPHIRGFPSQTELVLTWYREGGAQGACDELRIYLLNQFEGEARARSCKSGQQELGHIRLTGEELALVQRWVTRLQPYEAEIFEPAGGKPVTMYLSFNGSGDAEAFNSDIQAMRRLAEKLFGAIQR